MYKIIGGDRKEYGPVSAEELARWITEGRLNGQSLVQAEGSPEWKPLASFPEFAAALGAQAGQAPAPGAIPALVTPAAFVADVLTRPPEVPIGRCLSQSWDLLKTNFGLFLGAAFLVWLIGLVLQLIPFIGPLIYWVIWGVLYGGLYLIFLNRIRGRPASVGDVFLGFSVAFAQLLLAGFISSLLTLIGLACCLIVPGLYLFVAWIFSVPLVADKRLEFWSAMELSRKVVTRVWFEMFGLILLAFLPFILTFLFVHIKISITMFSATQGLLSSGPPDFVRMVHLIMRVARDAFMLALLPKIVLCLNLPFALGALMYAYENLFGPRATRTA